MLEIGSIKEETELVMKNLKAVLEAAEMTFDHVVKTSIFISDMNHLVRLTRCTVLILTKLQPFKRNCRSCPSKIRQCGDGMIAVK